MQSDFVGYGFSEDSALQLHLDVHAPMELDDMANSFRAIASLYGTHIRESHPDSNIVDSRERHCKLYVSSIENNCLLAQLIPLAGAALVGMGSVND